MMSMIMVLSCVPMMAFAEDGDPVPPESAEDADRREEAIRRITAELTDILKEHPEILDKYLEASEDIQSYLKVFDLYAEDLKENPEHIEFLVRYLDIYIRDLEERAKKYKDEQDEKIRQALEEAKAKAEELKDLLVEIEEKYKDKIVEKYDEWWPIYKDKIKNAVQALGDKVVEYYEIVTEYEYKAAVEELVAKLRQYVAEKEIKEKSIEAIRKLREQYQKLVAEYIQLREMFEDFNVKFDVKGKILDGLRKADELLDSLSAKLSDALKEKAQEILGKINGKFNDYLKKVGVDIEKLMALVIDVMAYASGYREGQTYMDVTMELWSKTMELDSALEDKALLEQDMLALEKELGKAQREAQKKSDSTADFENGYKVMTKKPAMKKAKAGKKKAKLQWKGIKDAKVSYYQVSYKTGKKTKKKTVKKATTSDKAVKYTLKKLKKGKKYTVKVRAVYTFKLNGKTYKFTSKWSKGKKVKIKK